MKIPLLVGFIGVPGAGKTTFATQLTEKLNAVTLNSDAMRLAIFGSREKMDALYRSGDRQILNTYTFGAIDYVAKSLLTSGVSVVYDAILRTHSDRDHLQQLADECDARYVFVHIVTDHEVAVRRGLERADRDNARRFTTEQTMREVVRHFHDELEPIRTDEEVVEISGELPFEDQYSVFEQALDTSN